MALKLGPIVGEVTYSSAKIWFHTEAEGRYACHVFTDPDLGAEVPGSPWEVVISKETGHTATVQVTLPGANQLYYYDIREAGGSTILPTGRDGLSFKTAPPPGTPARLSFGFVSCHKPFAYKEARRRYRMWDRMARVFAEKDVRLLLMIGDQVYADKGPDPAVTVEDYRQVYQEYWGHEAVMKVLSRYPTYMIWDDHEIRDGWGSKDGDSHTQAIFQAARQVYREFQHSHNPSPFDPDSLHYAFEFGQVGFLVLDLRGHRDLTLKKEDRPLLGRKQWQDLEGWLRGQARGLRVLFVVTSVPLVHTPPAVADFFGGGLLGILSFRDHWSYKKIRPEQRDLVQLLFQVANENDQQIVVLGGNVHVGTTAEIRSHSSDHLHRPLIYQFTSSPITNKPSNLVNKLIRILGKEWEIDGGISGRVLKHFRKRNFGLVHVNFDSNMDKYWIVFELYQEEVRDPYTLPVTMS